MTQPPIPTTKPLRGPHDLGEIVGYAYRLYLRDFVPLFLLALLTAPLQLLSGVISQRSDSAAAQVAAQYLLIPQLFVSLIVAGALIHATHVSTGGERASFSASLDAAFERFGAIVRTGLLLFGLVLASVLAGPFLGIYWLFNEQATIDGRRDWWLAWVPFVLAAYLAVRWGLQGQAVMIDRKERWVALDESADLVRGQWWRVLGIMLVVSLIVVGPTALAGAAEVLPPLASSAIISGVSALVTPFAVIAQTLLYYDLKSRRPAATAHGDGGPERSEEVTE
jgi:hypothetical protein